MTISAVPSNSVLDSTRWPSISCTSTSRRASVPLANMDSPPPSEDICKPPLASILTCSSTTPWSRLRMMYEFTTLPKISVLTPSSLLLIPMVPLPRISKIWLCNSMPFTVSFNQTVSSQSMMATVPVPPSEDSSILSIPVPSSLETRTSPVRCCHP